MFDFLKKLFYEFKEYLVVVILLIISLSVLSLNNKPGIKNFRTFSLGVFAMANSVSSSVTNVVAGDESIEALEMRNAELMLELSRLREAQKENEELKFLLGIKDTTSSPLIPASIISKDINRLQGSYIINIGAKDSVGVGMPVINDKGLVGLITGTTGDFSILRTLINNDLKIAVRDQESNVNGVLNWNGRNLVIKNIPTTYDVEIGDRVVTSQFSTIVPPSIPIGLITQKETTVSGLLSNIIVTPFVDFTGIRNVFVLKVIESEQIDSLELNMFRR